MTINLLFMLVFLSQIILISYVYPRQILRRMGFVTHNYPPQSHAKLYAGSFDTVQKGQARYRLFNHIILAGGLGLLLLYGFFAGDYDPQHTRLEALPLVFGMLQFIPLALLEISGFRQLRLMRENDIRTARQADLSPRRLFDFVSPTLLAFALVLYVTFILFVLYVNQWTWAFDAVVTIAALSLSNGLFVAVGVWKLYGRKLNPYQHTHDRSKEIGLSLHSMATVSIVISIFLLVTVAFQTYALDQFEIVLNSLYWQLIAIFGIGAMLRSIKIEDINFDNYKNDAPV